jgi:hypothetical protein
MIERNIPCSPAKGCASAKECSPTNYALSQIFNSTQHFPLCVSFPFPSLNVISVACSVSLCFQYWERVWRLFVEQPVNSSATPCRDNSGTPLVRSAQQTVRWAPRQNSALWPAKLIVTLFKNRSEFHLFIDVILHPDCRVSSDIFRGVKKSHMFFSFVFLLSFSFVW